VIVAEKLLLDSDVLIDFLRGHSPAVAFMARAPLPLYLSVITVAEAYAGVRDGEERDKLDKTLGAFETLNLDSKVAALGGIFRRDYGKSHGVGLADALIAATARHRGCTLATLNKKHYPMLNVVVTPYRKR
jgi:predicted nucleic acid-binding protein